MSVCIRRNHKWHMPSTAVTVRRLLPAAALSMTQAQRALIEQLLQDWEQALPELQATLPCQVMHCLVYITTVMYLMTSMHAARMPCPCRDTHIALPGDVWLLNAQSCRYCMPFKLACSRLGMRSACLAVCIGLMPSSPECRSCCAVKLATVCSVLQLPPQMADRHS